MKIDRSAASTTATIASGATVSDVIDLANASTAGFALPAAFTGVAMTFQVSDLFAGTYQALNNSAGAVSVTVAQGKSYAFPADVLAWPWVKLVSGSAEGGTRAIPIVTKR